VLGSMVFELAIVFGKKYGQEPRRQTTVTCFVQPHKLQSPVQQSPLRVAR
jgi:hypothetical protein